MVSDVKKGDAVWFVPRELLFERGLGVGSRFGRLAVVIGFPDTDKVAIEDQKWDLFLRFEYRSSSVVGAKLNELAPLHEGATAEFDHLIWGLRS